MNQRAAHERDQFAIDERRIRAKRAGSLRFRTWVSACWGLLRRVLRGYSSPPPKVERGPGG